MSSSILTNMSAMTAVQNLAATQQQLAQTQNEISTGLAISSAQDNAAYFSIAQTMRTNVSDLSAVSSSLNLGSSVISTGTAATGQLTSILQTISSDLTTAMSNVGNSSTQSYLQTAITGLSNQLSSIVNSASFNGVNLLNGSTSGSVSFVSGVTGTGSNTQITSINVNTTSTNLSGAGYTTGTNSLVDAAVSAANANTAAQTTLTADKAANATAIATLTSDIANLTTTDLGGGSAITTSNSTANFQAVFGASATMTSAGVVSNISANSPAGLLVGTGANASVTVNTTTPGLQHYTNGASASGGTLTAAYGSSSSDTANGTGGQTAVVATTATALNTAVNNVNANAAASQIYNGALFQVGQINLTSSTSAAQIQSYIQQVGTALTSVNTASETLGSAASQMNLQSTYISSLSDSLTSGVGSLVDADMNEASTRLSALQTQQQLGVQALSVANQNSQLILKLFGG